MANVEATQLNTAGTGSSGSSFNTASINFPAQRFILAAVGSDNGGGTARTTTLSGASLTWTEVTNVTPGTGRRITLFRAVTAGATSGAITVTHSGTASDGTNWSFTSFKNVDMTGTNGSNGVVQTATNTGSMVMSLTATLGAFTSADNATYGSIFINANFSITEGTGFTELGEDNTLRSIESEFRVDNDTTVNWTWGSNAVAMGIGVELKYLLPSAGFLALF